MMMMTMISNEFDQWLNISSCNNELVNIMIGGGGGGGGGGKTKDDLDNDHQDGRDDADADEDDYSSLGLDIKNSTKNNSNIPHSIDSRLDHFSNLSSSSSSLSLPNAVTNDRSDQNLIRSDRKEAGIESDECRLDEIIMIGNEKELDLSNDNLHHQPIRNERGLPPYYCSTTSTTSSPSQDPNHSSNPFLLGKDRLESNGWTSNHPSSSPPIGPDSSMILQPIQSFQFLGQEPLTSDLQPNYCHWFDFQDGQNDSSKPIGEFYQHRQAFRSDQSSFDKENEPLLTISPSLIDPSGGGTVESHSILLASNHAIKNPQCWITNDQDRVSDQPYPSNLNDSSNIQPLLLEPDQVMGGITTTVRDDTGGSQIGVYPNGPCDKDQSLVESYDPRLMVSKSSSHKNNHQQQVEALKFVELNNYHGSENGKRSRRSIVSGKGSSDSNRFEFTSSSPRKTSTSSSSSSSSLSSITSSSSSSSCSSSLASITSFSPSSSVSSATSLNSIQSNQPQRSNFFPNPSKLINNSNSKSSSRPKTSFKNSKNATGNSGNGPRKKSQQHQTQGQQGNKNSKPKEFLERNRLAAYRSRQKKKILELELESKLIELEFKSKELKKVMEGLVVERMELIKDLNEHQLMFHDGSKDDTISGGGDGGGIMVVEENKKNKKNS